MALKGSNVTGTRVQAGKGKAAPAAAVQAQPVQAQPVHSDPQTDRALRTSDDVMGLVRQVVPAGTAEQTFSTGSLGYRYNGKAVAQDGVRFQVTVQVVRIGTKQG